MMATETQPTHTLPPPPAVEEALSAPPAPSTAAPPTLSQSDLADLDALISPPWSRWARALTWLTLVVVTGFVVAKIDGGHLYPRPEQNGQNTLWVSDQFHLDESEGLAGVSVGFQNQSDRALRLADMRLVAPGTELVAIVQTPNSFSPSELLRDALTGAVPLDPLPLQIEPGESASFIVWVRPASCVDTDSSWGILRASVDFGEGGLPWTKRTFESEPMWSGSGEVSAYPHVGDGPLAVMCEGLL